MDASQRFRTRQAADRENVEQHVDVAAELETTQVARLLRRIEQHSPLALVDALDFAEHALRGRRNELAHERACKAADGSLTVLIKRVRSLCGVSHDVAERACHAVYLPSERAIVLEALREFMASKGIKP